MNANDVNPAVISVIEEPTNGFGTSALVILSRMAENDISCLLYTSDAADE